MTKKANAKHSIKVIAVRVYKLELLLCLNRYIYNYFWDINLTTNFYDDKNKLLIKKRYAKPYKLQQMSSTKHHDERIAKMIFASVYPHYVTKIEKKGRTKEELHQVIEWLTGYDQQKLQELIEKKVTFEVFFQNASVNPNASLITGVICGYRVEDIENLLTQQVRYLDKLVDELAKGRKMDKVLRGG